MEEIKNFENEKLIRISNYKKESPLFKLATQFNIETCNSQYTYNFSWLGLPIIQFPQDIVVMQEILYRIKPDLIIETGVARGGSLIFYSSILELIGKGTVVGVDIEIRKHNREAIESHPMSKRIKLIEGSSIDPKIIVQVEKEAKDKKIIMVCLDSKHTHDHVLEELKLYSKFVTKDSYLIVFDTTVETFDKDIVDELAKNYRFQPWGKGSNPHSAVTEFLKQDKNFEIDELWHKKAMITNCWDGFLLKK